MSERLVLRERHGRVGIAKLNRPEKLNALSAEVLKALCEVLESFDGDPGVRVMVLTGNARAFAAGADIEAMANLSPSDILKHDTRQFWQRMGRISKPTIAAVSGYAYGGGCELAMQCDLIVASETAQFAQPEIKLGIMPGAGGTQRLSKALGPYRAMEMVLTGEPIGAQEAYAHNLVNRVVPVERYLEEAVALAQTIAERAPMAVRMAREAVRFGVDHTLSVGMEIERRNYLLLYDTRDQAEGMAAFLEKRAPEFKGA